MKTEKMRERCFAALLALLLCLSMALPGLAEDVLLRQALFPHEVLPDDENGLLKNIRVRGRHHHDPPGNAFDHITPSLGGNGFLSFQGCPFCPCLIPPDILFPICHALSEKLTGIIHLSLAPDDVFLVGRDLLALFLVHILYLCGHRLEVRLCRCISRADL